MEAKIRTLIVDDERASRRAIEIQLREMADVEVVGQAAGGASAVRMIQELEPELVFLDVQMPELDGFQVLDALEPEDLPRIVFVTAHDAFAVRAFDVSATDYLLKPVDDRQLRRAIDRARSELRQNDEQVSAENLRRLMEHLDQARRSRPQEYKTRLLAKEKGKYLFIPVTEVEWLEAAGNYVHVHLDSRGHLIRASMSDLEQSLDPRIFRRVHRGAIVNLDRVTSIETDGVSDFMVVLASGRKVRVGRTYRDGLLQRDD